jgi:L-ascorbate metabolism protein UlaG (beta-lactamase superfamily)
MKSILSVIACAAMALFAVSAQAQMGRQVQTFKSSKGPIKITPVYHAAMVIEAGGKVIIVDPAKPADFTGLPQADLILITDIHGDHMDPALVKTVSKDGTKIIAPPAVVKTITTASPLSNGEKTTWDGWTIDAIPMYNMTSTRAPKPGAEVFHTKGRGNGYVLTYGGTRIYISGDTEGTPEMRALKNIDVAFICMNMPYTMTPEEAADAVKAFHPKVAIPYHYRANPPTDVEAFKKALEGTGIDVRLLDWYPKA